MINTVRGKYARQHWNTEIHVRTRSIERFRVKKSLIKHTTNILKRLLNSDYYRVRYRMTLRLRLSIVSN